MAITFVAFESLNDTIGLLQLSYDLAKVSKSNFHDGPGCFRNVLFT